MHFQTKTLYRIAILTWCIGLWGLIAIDICLRVVSGSRHALGMGEPLWFGLQTVLAVISLSFLFAFVRRGADVRVLAKSAFAIMFGGAFYLTSVWLYVIESGIDAI